MSHLFFEKPILNSPCAGPAQHGELDDHGQPSEVGIHWLPGVNRLGTHGRWAFAEFIDVWQMQDDFAEKVQEAFNDMIEQQRNKGETS